MKIGWCCLLLALSACLFSYCSQDKQENGGVVARINDYSLSLDELQRLLAAEMELEKDFKLTREARMGFLEELIKKELLIQEAKRMELDREERFIRTIERYWEATLIRDLMELKGEDILKRTVVSQEEITAYYDDLKKSGEKLPPLREMEESIRNDLMERKKTRKLAEWITDLRKKADIEINQDLLLKE